MVVFKRLPALAILSGTLVLASQAPSLAVAAVQPHTVVIGVDHVDAANQQPEKFRLFEYTDFFSREIRVHRGDTLDFQTAPGSLHIVALARNEQVARAAYPVFQSDTDDPLATGSGHAKILLGVSFGSVTHGTTGGGGTIGGPFAGPSCGLAGQTVCTFSGGNDVESAGVVPPGGNPGPAVDWSITINASPGTYDYFCYLHPGMQGKLHVVDADDSVSTQSQIDAASQAQFVQDRAQALEAEHEANEAHFQGGAPGSRTYDVNVGIKAADNHVAIDEMLPQHLNIDKGDKVKYHWADPHNAHTVGFPTDDPRLPGPFGPDAETNPAEFELAGDPGLTPAGRPLTTPTALVDAGLFIGRGYKVPGTIQEWSVTTNQSTSVGSFTYQCMIHDFMHGTLNVTQ